MASVANAALTWTWKFSQSHDGSRLVILVIADQLNSHRDLGWCCFPSLKFISKYTLLSERAIQDAFLVLIELGELEIEHKPGKLSLFRMPAFEASESAKKNSESEPEKTAVKSPGNTPKKDAQNGSPTPAESAPPQNPHPRSLPQTPPQFGAENANVSYSDPLEVPLTSKDPPNPPQAGGTPPMPLQAHTHTEKPMEVSDGIVWIEMGNRRRVFSRAEIEAYAGALWTCETMAERLKRKGFSVRIERIAPSEIDIPIKPKLDKIAEMRARNLLRDHPNWTDAQKLEALKKFFPPEIFSIMDLSAVGISAGAS